MLAPMSTLRTMVVIRLDAKAALALPTATSPPVRNSCSRTNGTASTAENGQPTIAPIAKHSVALSARDLPVAVDVAG